VKCILSNIKDLLPGDFVDIFIVQLYCVYRSS